MAMQQMNPESTSCLVNMEPGPQRNALRRVTSFFVISECAANTSTLTTNSGPCNLENSFLMQVTARYRELGLGQFATGQPQLSNSARNQGKLISTSGLVNMEPERPSDEMRRATSFDVISECAANTSTLTTNSGLCNLEASFLMQVTARYRELGLDQFATRQPQLLNSTRNQRKLISTSCIVNMEPERPSDVMRRAASFDAPCRDECAANTEDSFRSRVAACCREVQLHLMTPLLVSIVELYQESTALELCFTVCYGVPVSTIRRGKTPSKWWDVYCGILIAFRVFTSSRFVILSFLKDKPTQQAYGDVYHFLTQNIQALSFASVALQMPVLAMMVYFMTPWGKITLAHVLAITKYHVPGKLRRRVNLALRICLFFALGWMAVAVYIYFFLFDSATYWGAAIVYCPVTCAWLLDVFMGLAASFAIYFMVRNWQDRNFDAWLVSAAKLYDTPTFHTEDGVIVVQHLDSVLETNGGPSFYVGFFLATIHLLFIPLASTLFELVEGKPSHEWVRVPLGCSMVLFVVMYSCPMLDGSLFNKVKMPKIEAMMIKIEKSSGKHHTQSGQNLANELRSVKQKFDKLYVGVRICGSLIPNEILIFTFLWGVVMFYFIVLIKFRVNSDESDNAFNVTTTISP